MGQIERESDRVFPRLMPESTITDGRLTALLDEGAQFEGKLSFEVLNKKDGDYKILNIHGMLLCILISMIQFLTR